MNSHVAIVGASHAGVQTAVSLREKGYGGPITLIHGEGTLPYQRPPLSKAYLSGDLPVEALALRGPEYFNARNIRLLSRTRVDKLDARDQVLHLVRAGDNDPVTPTGDTMTFDRLVLATGACARKLPLPGATGDLALTLRNRTDADKLREKLLAARDVIIVGAGFIGLEVAATARKLGKPVTMVEAGDRILARLFPGQMSDFLARRHRAAGSELIFSAIVTDLRTAGDSRRRVTLDSGRVMDVDLVVAGIGARVNDHLARNAGLACEDGILVNEAGRTSHPHIYAAGDCAAWTLPHESRPSRTESVQNAVDQAKTVAASLCGLPLPAKSAPWFWSDQMDIKLQMVGNAIEADRIICRGDQESGRFSLFYYQQSRLVRVDSVNRPMDHMAARKLVTRRSELPPHVAADPAIKLTEYI